MEAAKVGGGGGEVRRLHIIYFLSRLRGGIEHPHLIRVHHLARNGVYLRDVKRWLGELRGKDLPEAFAWSYKRRYKAGYVWQDLLDDDLITPISDNEYVLKGSQINPSPLGTAEKKASIQKQQSCLAEEEPPVIQTCSDLASDTPRKVSSEISQESLVFSSDRSTLTDEYHSSKFVKKKLDEQNPDEESCDRLTENSTLPSSFYRNLLSKKSREKSKREDGMNSKTDTPEDSSFSTSSSSPSSLKSSFQKSKSHSVAASGLFRNLITCGTADANDAVQVMLNKEGSKKSDSQSSEICKVDKLGGSGRIFGTTWNHQQQQQQQQGARRSCDGGSTNKNKKKPGEFTTQYKPFGGPICSQCGKGFKPEKMGKHMKYCRGMKGQAKSGVCEPHRSSFSNSTSSHTTHSNCSFLTFT